MLKNKLFITMQHIIPQIALTRLLAHLTNLKKPVRVKNFLIRHFITRYGIDMQLVEEANFAAYPTFNDFFIRKLKAAARTLQAAQVVSPADGCISQMGDIEQTRLLQAKGFNYTLEDLLAHDAGLIQQFAHGKFATIYLSPKDYHRVHMPISGKLLKTIYVPGKLFSVNTVTAANVANLFARNERLICEFETSQGTMALIFVGAMFVAGIHTVWAGDVKRSKNIVVQDYREQNITLQQGEEAGYFKFGSTVILLFPNNSINWLADLHASQCVVMGQAMSKA